MVELLCPQRSRVEAVLLKTLVCGLRTEVDEELESISLMDDDLEALPLEPMLAPSRAPPPPFGEGAIL